MKKLFLLLVIIAFTASLISAERPAKKLVDGGAKPSDLLQEALDSNAGTFTDEIVASLDSVSRFRMQVVNVPFELSTTANDTNWYFVCAVPTGMTATLRAIYLTCETEPDDNGNTDGRAGIVVYDNSAADTIKKIGSEIPLDADSASLVAGDLTAFTMDSITTLAANDMVFIRTWADTANLVLEGAAVVVDIDYDE